MVTVRKDFQNIQQFSNYTVLSSMFFAYSGSWQIQWFIPS